MDLCIKVYYKKIFLQKYGRKIILDDLFHTLLSLYVKTLFLLVVEAEVEASRRWPDRSPHAVRWRNRAARCAWSAVRFGRDEGPVGRGQSWFDFHSRIQAEGIFKNWCFISNSDYFVVKIKLSYSEEPNLVLQPNVYDV